jgi:hypothetical protein
MNIFRAFVDKNIDIRGSVVNYIFSISVTKVIHGYNFYYI